MIKRFFVFLSVLALAGCASSLQSSGDFYTWVDERGRVHTVKRSTKEAVEDKAPKAVADKADEKGKSLSEIDPSDFRPSDEIDKKLSGKKLYSWNDERGQQIQEVIPPLKGESQPIITKQQYTSKDFSRFREGNSVLLSEILGREIKLEGYYRFNESESGDYLLIELDLDQDTSNFVIKSFVKREKVALPKVVLLDGGYQSVSADLSPFENYEPETWSSYSYFYGQLVIPKKAQYILVRPNDMIGVVEIGDKVIKMNDLGSLAIEL